MTSSPLHRFHVHVPWRNSSEWKNVYRQLFGEDSTRESMEDALNTLSIWKIRMPRLYSGIEGTLIILKGLLQVNDGRMADDVYRQLLASSVMRFLNICLTGPSRNQETFFHIARTKNLPEWIVNIRHDFTHSQRIPSAEMLRRALEYSFRWLQGNYWDPQFASLGDYVPQATDDGDADLATLIGLYEKVASADENPYHVTTRLNHSFRKFNIRLDKSKYVVLDRIANVLISTNYVGVSKIPEAIVNSGAVFNFTGMEGNSITETTLLSWLPMFSVLSRYDILLRFLKMLIEICHRGGNEDKQWKAAAWLKAICKYGVEGNPPIFPTDENFRTRLINFAHWAISKSNLHTNIYLKEMLILASFNDEFIAYTRRAMEALVPKPETQVPTEIYTIHSFKDVLEKDLYEGVVYGVKAKTVGWQIVDDASEFNGIPLGDVPSHYRIST